MVTSVKCVVAFEGSPGAVYPAEGMDVAEAVERAAEAAEGRRSWPNGEVTAFAYDGDVLRRFGVVVQQQEPRFMALPNHGPIDGGVAWTLLVTMRGLQEEPGNGGP